MDTPHQEQKLDKVARSQFVEGFNVEVDQQTIKNMQKSAHIAMVKETPKEYFEKTEYETNQSYYVGANEQQINEITSKVTAAAKERNFDLVSWGTTSSYN